MKQKYTAPQTKVAGTVSCRNVDPLLLTLPARARNKKTKIALEIKSTHQFNEDEPYYFIGFDFASQELQFFAMLAATKKYSGEDELERTALLGDSAAGTDFHSVTAKRSGVSRSLQKNLNYGTLYGASPRSQALIIKGARPTLTSEEALSLAKKANEALKGKKDYRTSLFTGGLGSESFNYIARNIESNAGPKVPVFSTSYPKSLTPKYNRKVNSGTPAAINYAIQSGCSVTGLLSVFFNFMQGQLIKYNLKQHARISCSIHDEVHLIAHKDYLEDVAKCMVRAHALTWAFLAAVLNIKDLPVQRLFYDIVIDVSKVLRKSADEVIDTPTMKYSKKGFQFYVDKESGKLARRDFDN